MPNPYTLEDVGGLEQGEILKGFFGTTHADAGGLRIALSPIDQRFGGVGDGVTNDRAAVQAAISAVGAGGVVDGLGLTYLVGTSELISAAGVTLRNMTLKKGFNGSIIRVNAANFSMEHVTLDGNQAGGFTGSNINNNIGGDDFSMRDCIVKNAQLHGIFQANTSRGYIENCRFSGNVDRDIFLNPTSSVSRDWKIIGNVFDGTGTTGANARVQAIPGAGGTGDCNGLVFVGNSIVVSNNVNTSGFAFNMGSGVASTGWTVADNVMRLSGNALLGFTFSGVGAGSCTGNTVDVNGFNLTGGAIELAACTGIQVVGNTVLGGTTLTVGIICDGSGTASGHVISGNRVDGLLAAGGSSVAGIRVIANVASAVYNDIAITGNNINWGGAGTGISGILVNTNNASAHADRILISGNVVRGNNAATTCGVKLNNNAAGVIDKCFITGNILTNVATAISQTGDTNTLLPASTNQT